MNLREGRRHGLSHRRRPADESAQLPALIVESARRRLDVTLGIKRGEFLRQAVGLQRRLVVGLGQIPVDDRPAGLPGDLGGKLRERIGAVAGELVDPARLVRTAREHGRRGRGEVGARGG